MTNIRERGRGEGREVERRECTHEQAFGTLELPFSEMLKIVRRAGLGKRSGTQFWTLCLI